MAVGAGYVRDLVAVTLRRINSETFVAPKIRKAKPPVEVLKLRQEYKTGKRRLKQIEGLIGRMGWQMNTYNSFNVWQKETPTDKLKAKFQARQVARKEAVTKLENDARLALIGQEAPAIRAILLGLQKKLADV